MRRSRGSMVSVLVATLLLAGCGSQSAVRTAGAGGSAQAEASLVAVVKKPDRACNGVSYREVSGTAPSYGLSQLRRYPALRYACRAFWLPHAEHGFVPQSLALDGHTAWVSGYKWNDDVAERACRLMQIDLRTGKLLADQGRLVGAPGDRKPTFCRHGGGLALDEHGLWIAEKDRLWLVDPDKVGARPGPAVIRVWRLQRPVYGSTLMIHDGRLVLARYVARPRSSLNRFPIKDALRPGVLDLVGKAKESFELGRSSYATMVGHAQGMTWRRGPVVTASQPGCGAVVLPNARRIGVIPGIEDVEFTGHGHFWMLSENSSKVLQRADRRVVPMLSKYDTSKVLALKGPGNCFGRG